jgi:hypothetical protein
LQIKVFLRRIWEFGVDEGGGGGGEPEEKLKLNYYAF